MTSEDLKDLFFLDPLISAERDRLESMPDEKTNQRREQQRHIRELENRKDQIIDYIQHLPNARLRSIITYRYMENLSWAMVAAKIGGMETEETVRKAANRFINRR